MSNEMHNNGAQIIYTYNVTRTSSATTTTMNSTSIVEQTATIMMNLPPTNTDISPMACLGFTILILATVGGNSLVLLALYLDKRLHSPSFYLIANMAIADLLLGLFVLPFSSVLELLNERWIFGETFCSAWLAFDVLCCTASIMALMAVSIDRYIGVTRPLNYSTIMTTRRTIYLVIVVWTVSILTSVVPLFGLTDRETTSTDPAMEQGRFETCKVNKDTFYTIFSSLISFYIPVIILLILYSRVYQEAQKQGQKLENEKRRLYQIDYQIASEHVRRKQTASNGHTAEQRSPSPPTNHKQSFFPVPDVNQNEVMTTLLTNGNVPDEETSLNRTLNDEGQFKKDYSDIKNHTPDDDTMHSGSSLAHHITTVRRSLGKRISSTLKRNSHGYLPHLSNYHHQSGHISTNDELLIIRRKLHNLKREKKAFRTLGLILSALLICWLPFFVTLPVMSILKQYAMTHDGHTEGTWFKITFWLGYCNSALNPFVYAFSNRAIRRAFRQIICRRFCCCGLRCWLCRCICPKKSSEYNKQSFQFQRGHSSSFATQASQVTPRRASSISAEMIRTLPRLVNEYDASSNSPITPIRSPGSGGPVVSFADYLSEVGGGGGGDDGTSHDHKQINQDTSSTPIQKHPPISKSDF